MLRLIPCGLLLATLAPAQSPPPVAQGKIGFTISGQAGSAGILCSGFQCTAFNLGIARGEKLSLAFRSHSGAPWILGIGPKPLTTCISLPGFWNQWAGPSTIVAMGTMGQTDLIRCWGGLHTRTVAVPTTGVNLKDSVVFQLVATNSGAAAFSAPVAVTVTK